MSKREPSYPADAGPFQHVFDALGVRDTFFTVIEASYDGIYITDGKANTLLVNHSYEVISGLDRARLIGHNMRQLVAEGVVSASGTLLALEKRETVTLEQQFETGKRAVITSTPTFDAAGNVLLVVTNVRDITELYTLRQQLRHEEQLNQRQLAEIALIREQLTGSGELVAQDKNMLATMLLVNRVAPLDTIVLLLGETGVGKDMIAAYIHQNSLRKAKSFIRVNCGAIPPGLLESELFGYEAGAFTGASAKGKLGLFEVADGGTIFLDEVGELPPEAQVKLLRVVQSGEVTRVGAVQPRQVDVRIIAATNRDLTTMMLAGRFREDLYYRLSVFPITVPPLRSRPDDVKPLAESILAELNRRYGTHKTLSEDAVMRLEAYPWPGNVRELRNVVERAMVMSGANCIEAADLAALTGPPARGGSAQQPVDLRALLAETEKQYLEAAYRRHKNVRAAAQSLGMSTATYVRRRNRYREEG